MQQCNDGDKDDSGNEYRTRENNKNMEIGWKKYNAICMINFVFYTLS